MIKATLVFIICLMFSGLMSQNMAAGEYWIDSDPGFGQATSITLPNSNDVNGQTESVSLSGLSKGQHQIGIRTMDENGIWSHTNILSIYIDSDDIFPIASSEHFVSTDPGFGMANDASIGTGLDINEAVSTIDVSTASAGQLFVCFRSQNSEGVWGLTDCRNLLIEQGDPGDVAAIEYLWDTDNGFGSGATVNPGMGNDLSSYLLTADVISSPGEHYLYVRTFDERGAWGHTHMDTVQVMPVGIDELKDHGFNIYPNPFAEQLNISPSDQESYFVDIRDLNGRIIRQERVVGHTVLDLEELASGVYQISLHLPSGDIYSSKISKK